jgi:hypothetical protein
MAVNLSPVGGVAAQFFTNTGAVLTGGKLYTYLAGTTTPATTYTTNAGNVARTNPIILDAAGRVSEGGEIWITVGVTYKFVLKDSNDVLIGTYDNVSSTFNIDSALVTYDPPFTGAVTTNVEAKLSEIISVKDFGAVGDGVTDDAPAISTAMNYVVTNGLGSIYFPNGTYYLATPVSINFDTQHSLHMYGTSLGGSTTRDPGGATITGAAGMAGMFLLTKTDLTTSGGYGFVCSNINFESGVEGLTGPLSAIVNYIGGSAARPWVVKNCNFTGFSKCIVCDITAYVNAGFDTGMSTVSIKECNFYSNNYSLYATGFLAILNIDFCDNNSENGGRILANTAAMGGYIRIANNLLEGQSNAIILSCGLCGIEITGNYFEANTSALISATASNPFSTITTRNNYITNCSGAFVVFRGIIVNSEDNFNSLGLYTYTNEIKGRSKLKCNATVYANTNASGTMQFDLASFPTNSTLPSEVLMVGSNGYQVLTSGPEVTPVGSRNFDTVSGNGIIYTFATGFNPGDWIVFQALARRRSGTGGLYVITYTNATVFDNQTDTSSAITDAGIGEWVVVLRYVQAQGTSVANFKFRWATQAGTQVDVTDTYIYRIATGGSDKPISLFLPPI